MVLDLVSDPGLFWPQRHRSTTQRMHDQLWKCPPVQPARSSGLRQEHGLLWRIVPGQKDIQRVRKIPAYLSTSTLICQKQFMFKFSPVQVKCKITHPYFYIHFEKGGGGMFPARRFSCKYTYVCSWFHLLVQNWLFSCYYVKILVFWGNNKQKIDIVKHV